MPDTYAQIWNRVNSFCPSAGALRAQRWTIDAFRRIAERRPWSWLVKYGQFLVPAAYSTGTATVTRGSAIVTGSGTSWDSTMVGRQFRIPVSTPIYTIAQVNSATELQLEMVYGGPTQSAVTYQIYQCYFTAPSDFLNFVAVWDPNYNWKLGLNYTQPELDLFDAQRANFGQSYVVASLDYSTQRTGFVSNPTQVVGTGPGPQIAGSATYTGPAAGVYTITITTGGTSGTAVFKWSYNSSTYTTGVTTDSGGGAQDLNNGVQVYFPLGETYVVGDTWTIVTSVVNSNALPRYEIWPHNTAQYVYPFLYIARAQDLDQPGAQLPYTIRGDLVMDMALHSASLWPGPSVDEPNPYFDRGLASDILKRCEFELGELERNDDELFSNMVSYAQQMQFAPWLNMLNASFLQQHAL